MFTDLRDLPFFNTLAPVFVVAFLWGAAHTVYIAPEIVSPRLIEKTYLPLCEARVAELRSVFDIEIAAERSRRAALQAEADHRWMEENNARTAAYEQAVAEAERLKQEAANQARQAQSVQNELGVAIVGGAVTELFGKEAGDHAKTAMGVLQALSSLRTLPSPYALPGLPSARDVPLPNLATRERLQFAPLPRFPINEASYCGCMIDEAFGDQLTSGLFSASLRLWKPESIRDLDRLHDGLVASPACGFNPN